MQPRYFSTWKPPQNQPIPPKLAATEYKVFKMDDLSAFSKYILLIGCIAPRPIALTTTIHKKSVKKTESQAEDTEKKKNAKGDGEESFLNCAPFSFFNIVSFDPPLISIGIQRNRGEKKDTLRNIEQNSEFTVSIISEHLH